MQSFRLRLILTLIASITLVSIASTYFEVISRKFVLRREMEQRTLWLAAGLQPELERALATEPASLDIASLSTRQLAVSEILTASQAQEDVRSTGSHGGVLAMAVFDPQGQMIASSGEMSMLSPIPHALMDRAMTKGRPEGAFGHDKREDGEGTQWLVETLPLHNHDQIAGALLVLVDVGSIHAEGVDVWRRSFLRIAAFVIVIVTVTLLMVRWFLLRPLSKAAERLRQLRLGSKDATLDAPKDMGLLTPLAREVVSLAESLVTARANAETEARLREAGEGVWTSERLAVHIRERLGEGKLFVVSNREPYMHQRKGREVVCVVPSSGLVTAIEPVLQACDGTWVAHGSGDADAQMVDDFDRLRVPPDDPRYTLRRVWLNREEEAGHYDGFSNEGLWPLCHIAHTRPIFRATDWECYQRVNEKFANVLLEEMEGVEAPVVFVQDYHFALLPRLIKRQRPDARVAIFWHIPWPNAESFGICPWQAELLDGLLGADLLGFHIQSHCNNFMATVDRVLEARTDWEHFTVRRNGHLSEIRPFPISVAWEEPMIGGEAVVHEEAGSHGLKAYRYGEVAAAALLRQHGIDLDKDDGAIAMVLGVDRLDYTKGIVERLLAIEYLFTEHPWYQGRMTFVQIASPSRTRIPSYIELRHQVEAAVERINERFQTPRWRPVVLIERQCSHTEVAEYYRAADVCLVTALHDGMNLVAKEYLASREDEDGMLVLSQFTGASRELADALLVNPYDIEQVAEAVRRGLEMPVEQRRLRMQRLRRQVKEHNVYRWAAEVLGELCELRMVAASDGQDSARDRHGSLSTKPDERPLNPPSAGAPGRRLLA